MEFMALSFYGPLKVILFILTKFQWFDRRSHLFQAHKFNRYGFYKAAQTEMLYYSQVMYCDIGDSYKF